MPALTTTNPQVPDDWPALWSLVLGAHQAAPDGAARASDPAALPPGDWTAASRTLFGLYSPLLGAGRRWCVGQLGQSLDGCIATAGGDSCFVTGAPSLDHLHRLRALSDAVLVGAGTVAADDPQLTTRRVPGPQPVRVVLDPDARLSGTERVLHDARAPTLWLCDARQGAAAARRTAGAEVVALEGLAGASAGTPAPDLAPVMAALAARGLRRVFVEGGGVTVSRFIDAGWMDRLHLVTAPVLIGDGRRGLRLAPRAAMADCPRPPARCYRLGDDVLWDLDLRAAVPPIVKPGAASR